MKQDAINEGTPLAGGEIRELNTLLREIRDLLACAFGAQITSEGRLAPLPSETPEAPAPR